MIVIVILVVERGIVRLPDAVQWQIEIVVVGIFLLSKIGAGKG